jgi:hypothetical protein
MSDDSGAAWHRFCERLSALGERVTGDEFVTDDAGRVDGIHHLATQTIAWLSWAVGYADPTHPAFFRQNDLVVRWGGPNVDQTTRRARIDPAGHYRISGNLGACEDMILTLKTGDMFTGHYGIRHEVMASELGYGPGDDVDITIGGPDGIPIADDVTMVNLREYYWNWQPAAPAVFAIERLDTAGTTPPPRTAAALAAQLDEAATLIESSISYWHQWVEAERAKLAPNTMGPPGGAAGGSERIRYSFCFYELADDEALLIEVDPAGARFRDIQLYSLVWFESLDFANRTTSLNHTQDSLGADGRLRVVVSATDPGVANWLDTAGRRSGMITQRWIGAAGEPAASARVVRLADLAQHLPAATPVVDASTRRAEIVRRQQHVAWRYRT